MVERQGQGVRVKIHRTSVGGGPTGLTDITNIDMPVVAIGELVDVLVRAVRDGYVNSRGEVRIHLTNYRNDKTVANGRLGVKRIGATKRKKVA
jgi:hypothetical protein